jgi:hypothetical protein
MSNIYKKFVFKGDDAFQSACADLKGYLFLLFFRLPAHSLSLCPSHSVCRQLFSKAKSFSFRLPCLLLPAAMSPLTWRRVKTNRTAVEIWRSSISTGIQSHKCIRFLLAAGAGNNGRIK